MLCCLVSWQKRHPVCKIPVPMVPKGSLLERDEERARGVGQLTILLVMTMKWYSQLLWWLCCRFCMYRLSSSYLFSRGFGSHSSLSGRSVVFEWSVWMWKWIREFLLSTRTSEDALLSWQSRVIVPLCRGSVDFLSRVSREVSDRIVSFASLGIAICYITSRGNLYTSHADF